MSKNTKNLIIWGFIFLIFFFPGISSSLSEEGDSANDYARIVNMDYSAKVVDEPGCEGKIVVTERFTFDVHAASKYNGFWELWRDLCEDYIDGVRVHYKVNSVKQILPDGREIIWPESPELYWDDYDYVKENTRLGPGKWFHSPGPYDEYYDRYECVFFYVDNLYREKITFEIEYEMYNAVLRYGDCADLYIAMYSGDTTKYLESFNGEILIPNKDMPRQGNYKLTTYGTNANEFPVEESSTKNPGYYTFSFYLNEDDLKFKSYNEYLEFDLVSFGEDKHKFADYASVNDYYYDNVIGEIWAEQAYYQNAPLIFMCAKIIVFIICAFISFLVIFNSRRKVSKWKEKFPFYSTDEIIDTYRNIPSDLDPKFAADLVFSKDKKEVEDSCVYSSILLSLARKGYVELEETSGDDVIIKLKEEVAINSPIVETQVDMFGNPIGGIFNENVNIVNEEINLLEPLTISETHYLNLIKRHAKNGYIYMNNFQNRIAADYQYTDGFLRKIQKVTVDCGVSQGYFQKANYLEPKKALLMSASGYSFWGWILLILVNLISFSTRMDLAFGGYTLLGVSCLFSSRYLKKQAHKFILVTEFGEEEYKKWRGLYNFLKSDTLINEKTFIELPIWEKYLVYATAFGISEKVIAAIKIRCPEVVAGTTSIVHNNYCRSGRIHSHSRRFHSSVRSGSYGHASVSSGYGGGGRGGGGGGGGH